MPVPIIVQPLPQPPTRQDPANFSERSDNFFGALPTFAAQLTGHSDVAYDKAVEAIEAADLISEFENRYLGPFPSDPAQDGSYQIGALYFKTTAPQEMRVFTGSIWQGIGSYTTGRIFVTDFIQARVVNRRSRLVNPVSANLDLNNSSSFVIDTNILSQLNFAYVPSAPGALDSLEFTIDLVLRTVNNVNLPTNVRWSGGGNLGNLYNKPTFLANTRQLLKFYTSDSGGTWLGSVQVLNASFDNSPTS